MAGSTAPEAFDPGFLLQLGFSTRSNEEATIVHVLFHDVFGEPVA